MVRAPLFFPRLASHFMAFAWGAIALSIGLEAVVYQNQLKSSLRAAVAPMGITLRLVANNLVHRAIACEVFCVLTFIVGLAAFVGVFLNKFNTRKSLQVQTYLFAFLTVALFATCIPVSHSVRTRSVEVYAWTADGTPVSDEDLAATIAKLGVNPQYKHMPDLLYFGIMPWFAFLFDLTSTVVSYLAIKKVGPSTYTSSNAQMAQIA
ncbi:hypothetical protein CYLTODRAFT_448602 [Cylindrobasidium torrendii FP15055 ss-10]|uniref:Uncharacterized protein n=1 Tax=Cylindrobasidium torrendii FP15055 ss-10 TaxID=1314674 RepID=A0A0D7BTZ6_9AGAR|nr:hypothetical protein CYLTODRAFT_448602 [Cylindrobasidium torrendii FP15055 ss-10]